MNKSASVIVSAVVAVVISLAVGFGIAPQPVVQDPSLGGIEHLVRERFVGGLDSAVYGGSILTVASGSKTYSAAEICGDPGRPTVLVKLDGDTFASAQAQKLPSAASLIQNCLPNKGDYKKVMFWNESVDENPTINFSTNTGLDAWIASSSAGSAIEIPADRGVWVKFLNFDGSTVSLTFEEVRDSD